jgi:hypothetical protein
MLLWHRRLWLIDHGATLYFHHAPDWPSEAARARDPFPAIKDHMLLRLATLLQEVDRAMADTLTADTVERIVNLIPDAWIADERPAGDPARIRAAYVRYLLDRLRAPRPFFEEAVGAR